MGIPTLISTATPSNAATLSITSGIDSTYDEYMFVLTDVNPATQRTNFMFQFNVDGASGYNEEITSTSFVTYHYEGGASRAALGYASGSDQANGTAFQQISNEAGIAADDSLAGILHLFSPASTTYVKHFYYRGNVNWNAGDDDVFMYTFHVAGYVNVTGAITDIQFKSSSGNFDGVIQMYGIA